MANSEISSIVKNGRLVFSLEYRKQPAVFWSQSIIADEQQYRYISVLFLVLDECKPFFFF